MASLHCSESLPTLTTDADSVNVLIHLRSEVSFLMKSLYNVLPSPHSSHCYREVLKGVRRHQKKG